RVLAKCGLSAGQWTENTRHATVTTSFRKRDSMNQGLRLTAVRALAEAVESGRRTRNYAAQSDNWGIASRSSEDRRGHADSGLLMRYVHPSEQTFTGRSSGTTAREHQSRNSKM